MSRLLILAAGVVLMITGCNGLLSGLFGTQKLRTLSVAEATDGVGDADYVRLTGGQLLTDLCQSDNAERYPPVTACPLVPAGTDFNFREGSPVNYPVVVWWEGDINIPSDSTFEGFISPLPVDMKPDEIDQGIGRGTRPAYLHLGERPLAWYWQLAILLGGAVIAVGSEAGFSRERREELDRKV